MKDFQHYKIDVPAGATGQFYTTCPECSSNRKKKAVKCLSVNVPEGVWLCHHCDWRGTLKNGEHKAEKKVELYIPPPKEAVGNALSQQAIRYFTEERKITVEVLNRAKLGLKTIYMPQSEGDEKCIAFPYFYSSKLVNVKYRSGKKHFRLSPGAELLLYGMDDIMGKETIIITEGEIDKLSCDVAGVAPSASVPNGAPSILAKNYSSHFAWFEKYEKDLATAKKIILAVDSDEPGKKLLSELSRRFGVGRCWTVEYPEGCKDPNEVLVNHGREALRKALNEALPLPVAGLYEVKDIYQAVMHVFRYGFEKGVSTGYKCLDNHYMPRPGEMTLITGIPSHGKSNLVDDISVHIAKTEGWRFGVFTPENQPLERHASSLLMKWTEKYFWHTENPIHKMSEATLKDGLKGLDEHYSWILPEEDFTLDWILEAARTLVVRRGIRGLIIDPWNEIEHTFNGSNKETDYISESLSKIRKFSRINAVHTWIVAHPQKLQKDMKTGLYPVPTPYDVSGSAHWYNKVDNAVTVWRKSTERSNLVSQVHIQKIRFRDVGSPGQVELVYNPVSTGYIDENDAKF